ncbi:MAG: riboflavin biosynthesis protein RibF [Bacteroidales bacterium]|nr:riboflavin biosynthesis protein RibF [Bacteroidales bacterium]
MVVATGFFDGVHLGHRFVIKQLVDAASERGEQSTVISFWPHPRNVLQNDARDLRLLTSLEEKKQMLYSLGVDKVEILNFTKDFSKLSTEQYLKDYVIGKFGATAILLGYDNRIGNNPGTPEEIEQIAKGLGLDVIRPKRFSSEGIVVSSTKVRDALLSGDVVSASKMLGYQYSLHGVVVSGNQKGRTIGFPTANMQLYEPLKLIPANGVYLVKVETLSRQFYGMSNIGVRPTVGSFNARTIETNIFDFDEDIYGLDLKVHFIEKIRDERKFDSLLDLKGQLQKDALTCREILSKH